MTEEEYRSQVYVNLLDWLGAQYKAADIAERCKLAGLCDELFDRSGRLLGRVREWSPRPDLSTVAKRNAFYSSDEHRNMTTAEKCAVQGDGFLNDYD